MPVPSGFIRSVISNDTSPIRFERFALELLSAEDGLQYVPTSRTYDRGRDGRAASKFADAQHIIACTTSQAIDSKIVDDVKRLAQTTSIASLTYCSSHPLTEHRLDAIEQEMRSLLPAGTGIRLFALDQLAALAEQHEAVLQAHYQRELSDLAAYLVSQGATDSRAHTGLRLAMLTQVGDDALALRQQVSARLILEQLADSAPHSLGAITAGLTSRLRLPRGISPRFTEPVVDALVLAGDATHEANGTVRITPQGAKTLRDIPESAANRFQEGRVAIQEALNELLGYALSGSDFDRMWPVFRDGIAELFSQHGTAIMDLVSSLLHGGRATEENQFRDARERLASRCALTFANEQQQDEVRQAVMDVFSARGSKAFDWLTSVCVVFVMMCSIGLESLSADEVGRVLRGTALVPDTDVLLSLLCEREDNHSEVASLLAGWRSLGGEVTAATPVLEEVAYHAWIADHDYVNSYDVIASLPEDRARYELANAFVRTFRKMAPDPRSQKAWLTYIDEFRGNSKHDHSVVDEILINDFGLTLMGRAVSESDAISSAYFVSFRAFLLRQAAEHFECGTDELTEIVQDKVRRDATLMAMIALLRDRLRQVAGQRTVVVVSSAGALRHLGNEFAEQFMRPEAVLTIPTVAALLSLTPGVRLGVESLRNLLFDTRLAKRLSPSELFVYRLLERSQYVLPISRRVTVARRFREAIFDQAKRTGRSPRAEEAAILSVSDPVATAQVVRDALNKLAITPKMANIVEEQQARIAVLEREIAKLRSTSSGTSGVSSPRP